MKRRNEKREKLPCPACESHYSSVLPRTIQQGESGYRRHRRCDDCGTEYETLEQVHRVILKRTAA